MMLISSLPVLLPLLDELHHAPLVSAQSQHRLFRFCAEYVLGTRLEILIHSDSYTTARFAAQMARAEIARLDAVFNHRRSDSELSRLHRARRLSVSEELFSVIQLAEAWRGISRGAFDGRMGALLQHWASDSEPQPAEIGQALLALHESTITLDPIQRWVDLSSAVSLSLDAVAKGYIVDAAANAARRAAPTIAGLAINIGGDIRCWGTSPAGDGWRIGIPDPAVSAENAPLVAAVSLSDAAIATSGRGPRDLIGRECRSTTISPFNGLPVRRVISATVVASHAADADAMATACLVLGPDEGVALVNNMDGAAARLTEANGRVHGSARWPTFQLVAATRSKASAATRSTTLPSQDLRWPADWELGITYVEPEIKEKTTDFRQPYIALWITDAQDKVINTVFLLGKDANYHHDNFIWWGIYNERAEYEVDLRSSSTTLSGRYQMYWIGYDEEGNKMPIGKYTLHLETSQEHGKHSYRTIPVDIGKERFKISLPNEEGSGGLDITYGHYNDRFKTDG